MPFILLAVKDAASCKLQSPIKHCSLFSFLYCQKYQKYLISLKYHPIILPIPVSHLEYFKISAFKDTNISQFGTRCVIV